MQKSPEKTRFYLSHAGIQTVLRTLNQAKTGKATVGTDADRKTIAELENFGIGTYGWDAMADACIAYRKANGIEQAETVEADEAEAEGEAFFADEADEIEPAAPSSNGHAHVVPTVGAEEALTTLRAALGVIGGPAPVDENQVRALINEAAETREAALREGIIGDLRAMVEEAAAAAEGRAARVLEIRVAGQVEGVKITGQHPLFEKVLRLVSAGINVLLVGPAGCGKTHLAEQVAKALDRPFGALSLTAGTSEAPLVGWLLPVGEAGRFEYVESPFVRHYANGGVFLFDELDAADPNMLLIVNSALANGHIEIAQRAASGLETRVNRHEDTVILGAANTFGTGANAQYVGRGALDAASLDRWYVVQMDYDPQFEAGLYGGEAPVPAAWSAASEEGVAEDCKALGAWVTALRAKVAASGIKRVISSRMIQKAVGARMAGVPVAEVKADLLAGWTADNKAAVGEA